MSFFNPLFSILIIIFLSILSLTFGRILYQRIFSAHSEDSAFFDLGVSFFIGLSALTVFWRFITFVTHHAASSLLAVGILSFAVSIFYKTDSQQALSQIACILKNKFAWALIFLMTVLTLALEVDPQYPQITSTLQSLGPSSSHLYPDWETAFANLGSSHSGIHAEVASFIYENNYIPVSGMDIGKSLLDAMPLLMGVNLPLLHSLIWLIIAKIFFLVFLLGFFQKLNLSLKYSLYGTFLIYFGNTALSLLHIIPSSSMAPVFFMNHVSPFIVLALLFTALLWINRLPDKKHSTASLGYDLLWVFILTASCIFGIHLLILLLPILLVFFSYFIFSKKYPWKRAAAIFMMMGFASLYCIFSGCGLTPPKLREGKLPISNLVDQVNCPSSIIIDPFVWYSASIAGNNYRGHTYYRVYDKSHLQTLQSARQLVKENWTRKVYGVFDFLIILENELWLALKIFFFPILGFLFSYFTLKKFQATQEHRSIFYASLLIFLLGFSLSFFSDFNNFAGARNTLSRFVHPGAILGLCLLAYSLSQWIPRIFPSLQKQTMAWALSLLIVCFGPALSLVTEVVNNASATEFSCLLKFILTH